MQLQLLLLLPKKKRNIHLDFATIRRALDFFFPYLATESYVNFSGGEPLLAFELIAQTVSYIQEELVRAGKKVRFALTTNGSLINQNIIEFLDGNKFQVIVSFDGLAQNKARAAHSYDPTLQTLEELLISPGIVLHTNSVFTARNVGLLSESMQHIMDMGVKNGMLSFAYLPSWGRSDLAHLQQELEKLRSCLLDHWREAGTIPVINFREGPQNGVFGCSGGKDRMALSADAKVWGCYLFIDYLKGKEGTPEYEKYCFGTLDEFISNHNELYSEISRNYDRLRMPGFQVAGSFCFMCENLEECSVCPVSAALAGVPIGTIPEWVCALAAVLREEKQEFLKSLETL